MDGGLLLEDGAAERSGEGQDDAAEADLKRSADSRVPENFAQNRGMASNLFLSPLAWLLCFEMFYQIRTLALYNHQCV